MDLIEELTSLKADFTAANDAKAALETKVTELTAQHEAHATAIAAKDAELETAKSELATRVADLTAAQEQIAQLEAAKQTAEQKAIELVAKQGIATLKVDVAATAVSKTKAEALAEYGALLGTDSIKAGEFFKTNKELLTSR